MDIHLYTNGLATAPKMGCAGSAQTVPQSTNTQTVHTYHQPRNQSETYYAGGHQPDNNNKEQQQHQGQSNEQPNNNMSQQPDHQQLYYNQPYQNPTQPMLQQHQQHPPNYYSQQQKSGGRKIDGPDFQNLEQRIEASQAVLTKVETDWDIRQRLSVYGDFKNEYTVMEIHSQNLTTGDFSIFQYHERVVSTRALKDLIRPVVRKAEVDRYEKDPDMENYWDPLDFDRPWRLPIFTLVCEGVKMSTLKAYLQKSSVASIREAEREYWENIKTDAEVVSSDLTNEDSTVLQEYQQVLQRFLDKYDRMNGIPVKHALKEPGDPNDAPFPLPSEVLNDPNVLRKWTEEWETLDTEVPEEGAWIMTELWLVFSKDEELKSPEEILIRDELDNTPGFSHDIDGDVAWNEIATDLVKDDVTTPEQDAIWVSRDNRPDLDDPKRMEKRRTQLEQYFIKKYEWDSSKLDPYRGFTDTLQSGWEKFQSLCDA